jgi:crotonobetainyl-CoA:carnitine CoA-transferase CaiB-like acyl-CoA transferase
MTLPLTGVKVVDFSEHGFVPSAAAVLGDWGADVVKIERPAGDPMRAIMRNNLVANADGTDYMFQAVNRNKRGISLDVTVPEGRAVFERLVAWADVYITNQLPRVRRKLHTEPDDLFKINPKLVFAKGHGQGQKGVDAEAGGFDSVSFWSRGGVGNALTHPTAERMTGQRPGLGDIPTGMFFAGGICAALVHAQRTGEGITVDTSLLNGAMWTLGPDMAYSSIAGESPPATDLTPGRMTPLIGEARTSDGRWLMLSMLDEDRYWGPVCRAVGFEEWIEQYPDEASRRPDWGPLSIKLRARITEMTRAEVVERFTAEGCIFSFYAAPPEVLEDPAVIDNGYAMTHPDHPTMRLSAAPAQFDDEAPTIRRPGPDLGQHNQEILIELGYSPSEIDALVAARVVVSEDGAR